MSSITKRSDGRFDVKLSDSVIVVDSQRDAQALASLPRVYEALQSGKPNADRIRAVLKVCDECRYNSFATRNFKSWLSEKGT